jgi:cation diffusion facilitator CzcD-associated flavoprotein CzcO
VSTPHLRVLVVGTGFSGIAMGAALRRNGIEDFRLLDRASDIGGTWRDNRYPGCACDVPSRLYSLSFAPKPDWSRSFAPAEEIWGYLRGCVDRFGLREHLVLGADVTSARWEDGCWHVVAADGRAWSADALVLGVGGLHVPVRPDIEGLDSFVGPVLHTADWPERDSLDGLRVAVVGTGASAVQLVPAIAGRVSRLTVFQRTASWVLPRHDVPTDPRAQRLYARFPIAAKAVRWATYWRLEGRYAGFGPARGLGHLVERQMLAQLAADVPDSDTRAKLTPHYAMGCKRVLLSDDYWPTFAKEHVDLVTDPIGRVEPHAVITVDRFGAETRHEVDVVVLATGFDVSGSFARMDIRGLGGRTLRKAWGSRHPTYLGITTAGFPELYLLLGPNTALGHNSVLVMIEAAVGYVAACLRRADRDGPQVVRAQAQARFQRWVDARTRHTVWASGCRSWYLDEEGHNIALWPATTVAYRMRTRRPRARDFEPVAGYPSPARRRARHGSS